MILSSFLAPCGQARKQRVRGNVATLVASSTLLTLCAAPICAQGDLDLLDQLQANRHAKRVCSEFYLGGRDPSDVLREDHDSNDSTVSVKIRRGQRLVEAKTLVGSTGRALYRPGLGCTILHGLSPRELADQGAGAPLPTLLDSDLEWPAGTSRRANAAPDHDRDALRRVLVDAFAEEGPSRDRGTRAAAVVFRGHLIAERYAPGYRADQPLITWSMNKTILAALFGILVGQERLQVDDPADVPEWQVGDDPRAAITYTQLLQMRSGLSFEEIYETSLVDVVEMLFLQRDMAAFAASKPLAHEPGTVWYYSSGTTNILARLLRRAIGGPLTDSTYFPRQELFEKIGMANTTLELDTAGNFAASSFGYSTARDLARFGLLLLQDGVWQGERILPEGWVAFMTTPVEVAPQRRYGAHIWLNAGDAEDPSSRAWPRLPTDMYWLSGFEGQSVVVIPSREAVIVRLGRTKRSDAWNLEDFVLAVLETLPPAELPAAIEEVGEE